ncbi:MAG: hypothetical protein WC515_02350 [Candidatus Omnitrophota bacterium]
MIEKIKRSNIFLNILLSVLVIGLVMSGVNSYLKVKYMNAEDVRHWPEGAFKYGTTGYEMSPSFSSSMTDGSFFIHSHKLGYRIPRHADGSIIEEGGILSLGCSFVYGYEVEAEQTFTYLAADSLHLPSYNYGVCASSYANVILQLKELKRRGILDRLKPAIIVLGAENLLFERSLSPFLPTGHNGPPLAGPYITRKDDIMQIVDPPSMLRGKHLFFPRMLYAEFIKKNYKGPDISPFELYDFVIGAINEIIAPYKMRFIILWMPLGPNDSLDEGFKKVIARYDNITLVNGLDAIRRYKVANEEYSGRHPGPEANMAYAQAIVSALRK